MAWQGAAGQSGGLGWHQPVLATGSGTDRTVVPGVALHATVLDSVAGAAALAEWAHGAAGRLLVVGGGLTGLEAAAELAEAFPRLELTLLAGRHALNARAVPGGFREPAIAYLRQALGELGVQVVENIRLVRLEQQTAVLADGRTLPFARCVWACGFRPLPRPAAAGLAPQPSGRIPVGADLSPVDQPDLMVIGDAAAVEAEPGGACRMSCAAGRPMGEAAAGILLARAHGRAPAAFRFAYTFRCVSLGRARPHPVRRRA